MKELSECYKAIIEKRPPNLTKLPIQYIDFSSLQRKESKKSNFQKKLAYWEQHLKGCVPLNLFTDKPRPATFSYRGNNIYFTSINQGYTSIGKLNTQNHQQPLIWLTKSLASSIQLSTVTLSKNQAIVLGNNNLMASFNISSGNPETILQVLINNKPT